MIEVVESTKVVTYDIIGLTADEFNMIVEALNNDGTDASHNLWNQLKTFAHEKGIY